MKSKFSDTKRQGIMSDSNANNTTGFIQINRYISTDNLAYRYANGAPTYNSFVNFFTSLDDQWIHIVVVCDYNNKTLKAYRNGVQFSTTKPLAGTPAFPSTNNVKYIGAYNSATDWLTDGSLDEVRIYNRELSVEEISAQYTSTKGKFGL